MARSTKTEQNRHLRLVLEEQERERSDLAHQLHDQLAQSLGAVLLGLEGVERRAPAAEAARLATLREQLGDALNLCTDLAVGLRPAVLDHLGLAPALESLAARAGAERVSVAPALATARFEPEFKTAVYRIVEEALATAPGCTLSLRLDAARHALLLSTQASDDSPKIGDLARLEARTQLLGGTFDTTSHALRIRIPIPRPNPGTASVFPQPQGVETPDGGRVALP